MPEMIMERRTWNGSVRARWPVTVLELSPARACWVTLPDASRTHPRDGTIEQVDHLEFSVCARQFWHATAVVAADGRVLGHRVEVATPVDGRGTGRLAHVALDVEVTVAGARLHHDWPRRLAERMLARGYPPALVDQGLRGVRDAARRVRDRLWPFDGWLDAQAAHAQRRLVPPDRRAARPPREAVRGVAALPAAASRSAA
jgi:hypothetical protein